MRASKEVEDQTGWGHTGGLEDGSNLFDQPGCLHFLRVGAADLDRSIAEAIFRGDVDGGALQRYTRACQERDTPEKTTSDL